MIAHCIRGIEVSANTMSCEWVRFSQIIGKGEGKITEFRT